MANLEVSFVSSGAGRSLCSRPANDESKHLRLPPDKERPKGVPDITRWDPRKGCHYYCWQHPNMEVWVLDEWVFQGYWRWSQRWLMRDLSAAIEWLEQQWKQMIEAQSKGYWHGRPGL